MAKSKVRKIEIRPKGGKLQVILYAEGQRGAPYVLKSSMHEPKDMSADLMKAEFWEGTGVKLAPSSEV